MRFVHVPLIAATLVLTGAAPAAAAPPERETFELVCDNGDVFDVEVNGNGAFTPARLLDSTAVLIPIAFGDFSFEAVLPDGQVISEVLPGTDEKGGGNVLRRSPRERVTCDFGASFTLLEPDPEFGLPAGTVVTFGGEVTAFLTGR